MCGNHSLGKQASECFKDRQCERYAVKGLAIRTTDFRLAFRLMEKLRSRGLSFTLLDAELPVLDEYVFFVSEQEAISDIEQDFGIQVACDVDTVEAAIEKAVQLVQGIDQVFELVFGIDPGPRPGLAWLADGAVIGVAQLERPHQVIEHIKGIASSLPHRRLLLRIGNGSRLIRDFIINDALDAHMRIEQVNESKTSHKIQRHDHTASALRISMLSGEMVYLPRDIEVAIGEIKDIKRRSRKVSEGRTSISTPLAESVARGEITIEEAIEAHNLLRNTE